MADVLLIGLIDMQRTQYVLGYEPGIGSSGFTECYLRVHFLLCR